MTTATAPFPSEALGPMLTFGGLCALGTASTLFGYLRERRTLEIAGKLGASTAFVAAGAFLLPDAPYRPAALAALALCMLGDALLLGTGRAFAAGILAFLLGHLAWVAAFFHLPIRPASAWAGGAVLLAVALALVVPNRARIGRLFLPVVTYCLAISWMTGLAVGAGHVRPLVAAGAVLFAASDTLVLRHRFLTPAPINRLVGLPMYFLGQLLLVAGLLAP